MLGGGLHVQYCFTHFLLDVTSSSAAVTLGLAIDNPSVCKARYVVEGEENMYVAVCSLHHDCVHNTLIHMYTSI